MAAARSPGSPGPGARARSVSPGPPGPGPATDDDVLARAAFAADDIFHAARRGDADGLDRFIHAGARV